VVVSSFPRTMQIHSTNTLPAEPLELDMNVLLCFKDDRSPPVNNLKRQKKIIPAHSLFRAHTSSPNVSSGQYRTFRAKVIGIVDLFRMKAYVPSDESSAVSLNVEPASHRPTKQRAHRVRNRTPDLDTQKPQIVSSLTEPPSMSLRDPNTSQFRL
jgi:hypothetical protein